MALQEALCKIVIISAGLDVLPFSKFRQALPSASSGSKRAAITIIHNTENRTIEWPTVESNVQIHIVYFRDMTPWSVTCVLTFRMKTTTNPSPRGHDAEGHNTNLHRRGNLETCGSFCELKQGLVLLKYNGLLVSDTV